MIPGVVTSLDPLRVQLRGDPGDVGVAVTAVSVDALSVGDKVLVGLVARQPTIFGRDGGTETLQLEPGIIDSELLADAAVTRAKIVEDAIDASRLAQEAVTEAKIAVDAITETKIADDAISTPKIAAGQVVTDHMVAGSIDGDRIAAFSIEATQIASYNLTAENANIGDAVIQDAMIGSVSAGKLTTGTINTGTITIDGDAEIVTDDFEFGSNGWRLRAGSLDIFNGGTIRADTFIGKKIDLRRSTGTTLLTIEEGTASNEARYSGAANNRFDGSMEVRGSDGLDVSEDLHCRNIYAGPNNVMEFGINQNLSNGPACGHTSNTHLQFVSSTSMWARQSSTASWASFAANLQDQSSHRDLKHDIESLVGRVGALDNVRALPMYRYKRNEDPRGIDHYGFLIEDLPRWVLSPPDLEAAEGRAIPEEEEHLGGYTVSEMIAWLLAAVQELADDIDGLTDGSKR